MPRSRPRTRNYLQQKRKVRKQWIAFWLILAITVSTLIAIMIIVLNAR